MLSINKKRNKGSVLLVTLVIVFLVTMAVMSTMGGVSHQEVSTRNYQFRQSVFTAASSELGAQIREVNINDYDDDDTIILDLMSTRGTSREYELSMGTQFNPLKTTPPPHLAISSVTLDGEMAKAVPCPGESIGSTKVLMGTIGAHAELADTGIQSTQNQHFLYCWP